MEKSKLLKCPFCGSDKIRIISNGVSYHVNCDQCECQTTRYRKKDKAIEAWNRRADDGKD